MKTIKIIFLLLFASYSSNAQDPQLLENTWHFSSGVLIGEALELPFPEFMTILDFDSIEIFIHHPSCEHTYSGIISFGITDNIFELEGSYGELLGTCLYDFMLEHLAIYYDQDLAPKNPFNYTIEGVTPNLTLTITNGDGDFAIYNNHEMANSDFSLNTLNAFPNPVKDILHIQNIGTIENIKVYDILGKLVINKKEHVNQLDVSLLKSGLLLIKFETNKGTIIKKIVKE